MKKYNLWYGLVSETYLKIPREFGNYVITAVSMEEAKKAFLQLVQEENRRLVRFGDKCAEVVETPILDSYKFTYKARH